jgi:hypothetical protein
MRGMFVKAAGMSVCAAVLLATCGCAIMDQMVKTQTSDGDAKMTQLGEYLGRIFL